MTHKHFDVVVAYTDGSDLKPPQHGTGVGIHLYAYNNDFINIIGEAPGAVVECIPELLTTKAYTPNPVKAVLATCPTITEGVTFYECSYPIQPSTSQVAELMAFVTLLDEDAPVSANKYYIYTDSMYLINGVLEWMYGWAKRGWVTGSGSPVKNVEIWKKIYAMWPNFKDRVELIKIKGHSDRFGNDEADRLAGISSAESVKRVRNGETVWLPHWSDVTDEMFNRYGEQDDDSEEGTETKGKAKKKNKPSKKKKPSVAGRLLPIIATSKLYYILTNEESPTLTLNGENYHYLLCGDHAKDKSDVVLLGKYFPDAMFSIIATKEKIEPLYRIANEHNRMAWGDTPMMSRYDTIACVNGLHASRKKFVDSYNAGIDFETLERKENDNVLMMDPKTYISELLRPPLLSYRSLEIRDELTKRLIESVNNEKGYCKTDITSLLFDEAGKPSKTFYRNIDRSFKVNVPQPVSDKKVPVIIPRGIALPDRTNINRIKANSDGKFYIVTWQSCERVFDYALVYESETEYALWSPYYAASRVLGDKEL